MTADYNAGQFVEIFHTDSRAEAERLVEVVLRSQGIEAVIHDRIDHALPAPSSQTGDLAIAVPAAQRDQAVAFLEEYLQAAGAPDK